MKKAHSHLKQTTLNFLRKWREFFRLRPTSLEKKLKKTVRQKKRSLSLDEISQFIKKYEPSLLFNPSQNTADIEQLKRTATLLRYTNEHELYENTLFGYDPKLTLLNQKAARDHTFIIGGHGKGTIRAYRHLKHDDRQFFEKIYIHQEPQIEKLLWFYLTVLPQLKSTHLKAPQLYKAFYGDKLTATYFEYISNLTPTSPQNMLSKAMALHNYLYNLRDTINLTDVPQAALNYENAEIYQRGLRCLKPIFSAKDVPFVKINNHLSTSNKQLCHGDLNQVNILENDLIIDWDECGLYPAGYDLALAMSRSKHFKTSEQVINFINGCGLETHSDRVAAIYFCTVFFSLQTKKGFPLKQLTRLVTDLEALID